MCGIAGVLCESDQALVTSFANEATQTLRARGPDDHGYLGLTPAGEVRVGRETDVVRGARLALVHRRLSIIDLTETGWQPMSTADGRYHLVFNGEIYNHLELRRELEALGIAFRGRCDTEVLLQAFATWGQACLPRLTGMFAFAILDRQARTLTLARDPFGIKPLYYCQRDGQFAFASEIKALRPVPWADWRIDWQQAYDYLRFSRTDATPQTLFAGVRQLMPGCCLRVPLDGGPLEHHTYWQFDPTQELDLSYDEAANQLRELFVESVQLHLRSDVPVGTCLSGGIDSSSIVMVMRQLLGKDGELHTFSYLPADPKLSEERWIDVVNEAAGAVPHKVSPEPAELVHDLDRLIWAQDQPFGGTSIYAQHRVFRSACENRIPVMLDGQGADELLGGYQGMSRCTRLVSLLRQRRLWRTVRYLLGIARHCPDVELLPFIQRSGRLALREGPTGERPLGDDGPVWLDTPWFAEQGVRRVVVPEFTGKQALRSYLYQAMTCTSLPRLLRYEDRNSMTFSVESRVPFLTPQLAQFMLSLPEGYLVDDRGTTKSLFRTAMRGIVPDAILDRKDKVGFTTPIRSWLDEVGEWVQDVLNSDVARQLPGLNHEVMQQEWGAVRQGRSSFGRHTWRWVNFIRWVERFEPKMQ